MVVLLEDHQGKEFLEGASATREDDEGIGVFDHDFHAGVDVFAQPELGEPVGESFQFDDVGDV